MSGERDLDPHDRTLRLSAALGVSDGRLGALRDRRVVLELSASGAGLCAGRLAFLSVCNLAARLGPYAPHLEIRLPDRVDPVVSGVYALQPSLADQARWILTNATSADTFVRGDNATSGEADVVIAVGEPTATGREVIRLGWGHSVGEVSTGNEPLKRAVTQSPLGAMVAAALAVARLHALQARAIGGSGRLPSAPTRLGALSLTEEDVALGEGTLQAPPTLLVGAGALGSAFVYALSHIPFLSAPIDVVDSDVLKPSNANRQITSSFEHARRGNVAKVDDLASVWSSLRPFPKLYDEFKRETGRGADAFEIAVTALDNIAARRDVASDLPKILIDGATGGLMVALTRGADPAVACLRCVYPEVIRDEDGRWAEALGCSRDVVGQLRTGTRAFDHDVIEMIRRDGSYDLTEETEDGLRRSGWAYLARAPCGRGAPRGVPSGSVSYVSALCGFLMAGQYLTEILSRPTLEPPQNRWEWDDVLAAGPSPAGRTAVDPVARCTERHARLSKSYRDRWGAP